MSAITDWAPEHLRPLCADIAEIAMDNDSDKAIKDMVYLTTWVMQGLYFLVKEHVGVEQADHALDELFKGCREARKSFEAKNLKGSLQ